MQKIIKTVQKELIKNIDQKTQASFQRFFKEEVKCYGVKTTLVTKIAKDNFPKDLNKKEVFELCEELFKTGYSEEAFIASKWVYKFHKNFTPEDFKVFERWSEFYIDNWAKCDTFSNHTMGAFLEKYPEFIENLIAWTKSKNRWVKRAAAVSLIIPARRGLFLEEIFQIADALLLDPDDMVEKGYGWLLKEASHKHQQEIFRYVMKNKQIMPRTSLRYAIEKMPLDLKKQAMEK